MKDILKKTAIVILSCKDYESLEVSLPNYLENTPKETHFFILQNGFGTYDKDRTARVAHRISDLYPERVTVVDWIPEGKPYYAIKQLLHDEKLSAFDYICKVDDDTFPVTKDWLEKLAFSYIQNKKRYGNKMAFTLPLVNNNPWGFKRTVELMGLEKEYDESIGRIHYAGTDEALASAQKYYPLKVCAQNEIFPSGFGTVWRYPYMARWIHEKTTLNVDVWVKKIENAPDVIFDNTLRYSINCMFFEKPYWNTLGDETINDEVAVHEKSLENKSVLIACQSIPFVHLFFFSQRDENKDLLDKIRPYYQRRLKLNYPIQLISNKEYELENRLRYLEENITLFEKSSNKKTLKRRQFFYEILRTLSRGKAKKRYEKKIKEISKKL